MWLLVAEKSRNCTRSANELTLKKQFTKLSIIVKCIYWDVILEFCHVELDPRRLRQVNNYIDFKTEGFEL